VKALPEYVTVSVAVFVLLAASVAVTVSTFDPDCRAIPLAVQLVVPVAVPLPAAVVRPRHPGHPDVIRGGASERQRSCWCCSVGVDVGT